MEKAINLSSELLMLSVRKSRMYIPKTASLSTPEQNLEEISLLQNYQQWNPQSQRQIKVDEWMLPAENMMPKITRDIKKVSRQSFKSYRSASYNSNESSHEHFNKIAAFLSTESTEFKKYKRSKEKLISSVKSAERDNSAILNHPKSAPRKTFQYLRKNSRQKTKEKNNENNNNASVSSITYPILTKGCNKIDLYLSPQEKAPMVGTVYNLLHRKIAQRR